jgi:tRNA threonylcarbamoyladenosine biosynthesis protein TsaB
MLILAFDTALAACSVAVWRDGETLAATRQLMERGQAEHLVPMIDAAMTAAGVGFDALDRIAVTIGPGSFTGVRVALATARGLALSRKIPVIGLTTGEVLAAEAARTTTAAAIISLIDSKRGDVYVERFTATGAPVGAAGSIPGTGVRALIKSIYPSGVVTIVGDGASVISGPDARISILTDVIYPDAAVLAACAAARTPGTSPVPLYVRPPDVTMPSPP